MTDASTADLAESMSGRHVVVVGGGIAGLVAALELAEVGLRVTLIEEGSALGGTVGRATLADQELDLPVEGFSSRGAAVRALADRLGLDVVSSHPLEPWIVGRTGAAPVPRGSLAGIPANPWDAGVRSLIGWRGAWRAYLDRLRPPLTIGRQPSLGRLVRTRMGDRVLDRLVAPVSLAVYGIHPDDVDVEAAAPGLSTALTRTGSLAGGVGQLTDDDAPAPVLAQIDGGMARLVTALRARLDEFGVVVLTDTRVESLARDAGGRWSVEAVTPADGSPRIVGVDPADAVVVAASEIAARSILTPHVPALDGEITAPATTEVVTLVVHAPALDRRPRGDAVYAVPGSRRATGLVVSSLRWPALAERQPHGQHVLRIGYGTQNEAPATADLDDEAALDLAHAEAQEMLGVALLTLEGRRDRFPAPQPASALGHDEHAHAARAAVRAVAGLGATGAWLSGPGLAQVVPDAVAEADRVRRALLWGARRAAD